MNALIHTIENYIPFDRAEAAQKNGFLYYLRTFGDQVSKRENLTGHLTASAWIVNQNRTKVLMCFHHIYQAWSWLGGHADGEMNLSEVALKEVHEESGLSNVRLVDETPISLSINTVSLHEKRGRFVPPHLHFNVCYLVEADENAPLCIKPDENAALKWFKNEQIASICPPDDVTNCYLKMIEKIKKQRL